MIREEVRRLACAFQFLTRMPIPVAAEWSEQRLARSARYFPLVGLTVGTICAGVFLAARIFWPGGALPALLAVGFGVLLTGAFHEDGLADTVDGLGGGHTPAQRLAIMKDSRIGAYGVLALGLSLALKVAALTSIVPAVSAAVVLVCAHGLSRGVAVAVMSVTPYAADPEGSKVKAAARGVRRWEALVALAIGAAPLALLSPVAAAICTLAGALAAAWPALAARCLIGGHTGDVLGAVEQAFEASFVLTAAALCALSVPLK